MKTKKINTFVIAKTLMMPKPLRFIVLQNLDYLDFKVLDKFGKNTIKQHT